MARRENESIGMNERTNERTNDNNKRTTVNRHEAAGDTRPQYTDATHVE